MEEHKNRNTPRDRQAANREFSETGAENQAKEKNEQKKRKSEEEIAEMNGRKGKIETEHTEPTGRTSAIPGADEEEDLGTSSSGAGLGGNKGTGTRRKDEFR